MHTHDDGVHIPAGFVSEPVFALTFYHPALRKHWLEGDDLDSESFFAGVAGAGPSLGQRDFGLKSPKQQLFKSHPPHLPKVALFPAGGELTLALLVKGQGHLKHLSSSLILY